MASFLGVGYELQGRLKESVHIRYLLATSDCKKCFDIFSLPIRFADFLLQSIQCDKHAKMTSANITATINYLTDSAHLLYASAPETSAHLLRERRELLVQQNIPIPEAHRQHFCGACGNIMIPGEDESSLRLDARKPVAKKKTRVQNVQVSMTRGPVKNITCGRCHRTTRMTLPAPAPAARHQARKPKSKAEAFGITSGVKPEAPKASTNASSKKRAKSRKAGLQSLLSGHQKQQSRPLSLADFMNK